LNWTILFKCLEMTIVVIWRYINKTELNWIELKVSVLYLKCNPVPAHVHFASIQQSFVLRKLEEGADLAVSGRIDACSWRKYHWNLMAGWYFHFVLHRLNSENHHPIRQEVIEDWEIVFLYKSHMLSTWHALWEVNDDFTVKTFLQPVTGHATGCPSTIRSFKWETSSFTVWNWRSQSEMVCLKFVAMANLLRHLPAGTTT